MRTVEIKDQHGNAFGNAIVREVNHLRIIPEDAPVSYFETGYRISFDPEEINKGIDACINKSFLDLSPEEQTEAMCAIIAKMRDSENKIKLSFDLGNNYEALLAVAKLMVELS